MFILLSVIILITVFVLVFINEQKYFGGFIESIVMSVLVAMLIGMLLLVINGVLICCFIEYDNVGFIKTKNELYPQAKVKVIENNNFEEGYYLQEVKLRDNFMNDLFFFWNIPDDIEIEYNKLYLIKNSKK